ncbi:MAG: FKBP-type peptidyl-prolyl cis-trans isomerase [Gammaproteobacteria bacterium]|nr:FKBP-type peptidyl-prolyl cis-trans isomerase [Gammaproteobacteria bacterium]
MNFSRISLLISGLLLVIGLSACHEKDKQATNTAEPDTMQEELTTDADKFSYALGMMIGERVLKQYGEVDYDTLLKGMKAQHQDQETLMDIAQAGEALAAHQQKADASKGQEAIAEGEAFLKANAEMEGVTITESGLQYSVLTAAEGNKPAATDTVTVHYRGTLLNGKEFDSSYSRDEPATFALNRVIPGWTEGVQLMSEGSKFRFVIPYQLAYGERGTGADIGPYETLVFEVELIKIN